eukprot:gene14968-6121_t
MVKWMMTVQVLPLKVVRARPDNDPPNTPEEDFDDVIRHLEQDDLDKDVEKLLVGPVVGDNPPDPLLDTIAEEWGQDEAFSEKISEKLANKILEKYKTPEKSN